MLPLLIPGIIALGTTLAGGVIAANNAKKKGHKEGYHEAEEKCAAQINEYKKKLQELQRQREATKEGFKAVMDNISSVELSDGNFFSKAASLFKGYTVFHVYVVTCISYTRYQILKHKISNEDAEELKTLVLGLIETGFPNNLKNDVDAVWSSSNLDEVTTAYHKYYGKLAKNTRMKVDETKLPIDDYLKQYAENIKKTEEFEKLIAAA
jgi:hypothetical protein